MSTSTHSTTRRSRRLNLAGYRFREKDKLVCRLLLWSPIYDSGASGRALKTYIEVLEKDTGLEVENLRNVMVDRISSRATIIRLRSRQNERKVRKEDLNQGL